jgi:arylsulfatase A-like enzyme
LKTLLKVLLQLLWGAFLLLSALYCLLAFLPYTFAAVIKAPPYDWVPWFVHHHVLLYWVALAGAVAANWSDHRRRTFVTLFSLQAALGIWLALRPPLPALQDNASAYVWSVAFLLSLIATSSGRFYLRSAVKSEETAPGGLLAYSTAVFTALGIAALWLGGIQLRNQGETGTLLGGLNYDELAVWSLISHVLVALIVVSALNLIRMAANRTAHPLRVRRLLVGLLIFLALWFAVVRFLDNALAFAGPAALVCAALLAAALTLLGFDAGLELLAAVWVRAVARRKLVIGAVVGLLALATLLLPQWIGGGDWNGIIQHTCALAGWLALGVCAYCLRPRPARYSLAAILAVLVVGISTYKGLQASAIFWGKGFGPTDYDVAAAMEEYAARDASFELAHHILGNGPSEHCADLCRIMRQYSNITGFEPQTELNLVASLEPAPGARPNIFIFIIDSMRPDYLGAYNPRVDFTPNLDAFARDSVVVHNAFTQYAGTTLSEPAIWSGAMLLHDHDLSNFSRLNSLAKLARTDDYDLIVSYDTMLKQMFRPKDMTVVDAETLWNRYELCSTMHQTEQVLEQRSDKQRPVMFYAQPMNVHQFASNDVPSPTAAHWQVRPGFNSRISYEVHYVDGCLGAFFGYLKQHGMYDNSIIVVASDHGDATGEFGRFSHSLIIYPEIIRVPLIIHLPAAMRDKFVHDDHRISALTDITPSLYYLLGHRPIEHNPLFGRPLFAESAAELESYRRKELFVASDVRAVYGILADNGRSLYTTYDAPAQSMLFDLASDPNAQHNILTPPLKQSYDTRVIEHLQGVADFYGYKPGVGSLLTAQR